MRLRWLWPIRLAAKRLIIMIGLGARLTEYCDRCGRRQPLVWWSDDSLYAAVMGTSPERGDNMTGSPCPECFDEFASKRVPGLILRWWPVVEHYGDYHGPEAANRFYWEADARLSPMERAAVLESRRRSGR